MELLQRTEAPFTAEQVFNINEFQKWGLRPFCCLPCRQEFGQWDGNDYTKRRLVAFTVGLRCLTCDHIQDWCYTFIVEGMWEEITYHYLLPFI